MPFRLWQRMRGQEGPLEGESTTRSIDDPWGPEVYEALAGRYGARSRRVPGERAVLLSCAIPVRAIAPLRISLGSAVLPNQAVPAGNGGEKSFSLPLNPPAFTPRFTPP